MKEKSCGHLNKCKKTFDRIQHSFMIKTLLKLDKKDIPQHNKGHI